PPTLSAISAWRSAFTNRRGYTDRTYLPRKIKVHPNNSATGFHKDLAVLTLDRPVPRTNASTSGRLFARKLQDATFALLSQKECELMIGSRQPMFITKLCIDSLTKRSASWTLLARTSHTPVEAIITLPDRVKLLLAKAASSRIPRFTHADSPSGTGMGLIGPIENTVPDKLQTALLTVISDS
ncbi:hypothetical protein BV898_10786, partial [Hypsibius exemplaris]